MNHANMIQFNKVHTAILDGYKFIIVVNNDFITTISGERIRHKRGDILGYHKKKDSAERTKHTYHTPAYIDVIPIKEWRPAAEVKR